MDKDLKNKIKSAKKLNSLIKKNEDEIKQILVSEWFLHQILDVAEYFDIDMQEDETGETLFINNIPVTLSHFINKGCILLLKNDEFVVLKGI